MFIISDKTIKSLAANDLVYQRGLAYFRENRVEIFEFPEEDLCLSGIVFGSNEYQAEVYFSKSGKINDIYCDCAAFSKYEGACKHVVALLIDYQQQQSNENGPLLSPLQSSDDFRLAEDLFEYYDHKLKNSPSGPVTLEITLERESVNFGGIETFLTFRIGEDKLYIVKSVKKLIEAIYKGEKLTFGKHFAFDPSIHTFVPEDRPVIDLLTEMHEMEERIHDDYWRQKGRSRLFQGRKVILTDTALKRFFSLVQSERFSANFFNQQYANIKILEQDMPLQFTLDKSKDNLLLNWERATLFPLVGTGDYFFYDGTIYKISESQKEYFLPLLNAFIQSPGGVHFSSRQKENFVGKVLPLVKKVGRVEITPAVKESFHEAELNIKVFLDRAEGSVQARVEFAYGEIHFNPFAAGPGLQTGDKILIRDMEREEAVLAFFERAEFRILNGSLYLKEDAEEKVYKFIFHILPEIQRQAEVFYSESFGIIRVRESAAFSGGVRLNEDSGLLEFSFGLEDIDVRELGAVFRSLREKKKYHRLKDGSFLLLDSAGPNFDYAVNMIDSLGLSDRDLEKKVVQIPKYRALYIDRCLKESNWRMERNSAFKQLVQNINEPGDMEFDVPDRIQGVLRGYQKTGFKWLKTLSMYGLGGILADDMGLGKTIQAIAFIMSERDRVSAPALVVAPTSVVYNWQDEVQKFAPDMRVVVISGTPGERETLIKEAGEADLVVTSYALMRRDVELYKDISFGYCFLDEAQHIKNPGSLNARAVKTIKARGYFALTGTPLENSLTELWSVFDFVMQGYLLSHTKFTKKYERPIVKDQDKRALRELQKQISPFIMRRMKKDVLRELPPKIESRALVDLTGDQKKVYLSYLQRAKGEIEDTIMAGGFEKSRIKILSILTRLRQICCHPATFLEDYQGDSGKLLYLREMMKDAVGGGHRILIFSQFTSMLEIIRSHLDSEKIDYFYLDGSIGAKDRGRMAHDFNRGDRDAFLISLKAGGTGLNLTGADMVIHYDPWWNPAVEDQASDRAYRIGQKNSVQVIKLISRGTIEEKIYDLQQKKKAMIESVIKPGETMLSKMTEQEIRDLLDIS